MTGPTTHDHEFETGDPCKLYLERRMARFGRGWRSLSWRSRLAWRLRWLADRVDGQMTLTLSGSVPEDVTRGDLWDALTFGLTAARRYIVDLHRDRSIDRPQP